MSEDNKIKGEKDKKIKRNVKISSELHRILKLEAYKQEKMLYEVLEKAIRGYYKI